MDPIGGQFITDLNRQIEADQGRSKDSAFGEGRVAGLGVIRCPRCKSKAIRATDVQREKLALGNASYVLFSLLGLAVIPFAEFPGLLALVALGWFALMLTFLWDGVLGLAVHTFPSIWGTTHRIRFACSECQHGWTKIERFGGVAPWKL